MRLLLTAVAQEAHTNRETAGNRLVLCLMSVLQHLARDCLVARVEHDSQHPLPRSRRGVQDLLYVIVCIRIAYSNGSDTVGCPLPRRSRPCE